jgi:hypothetical protein
VNSIHYTNLVEAINVVLGHQPRNNVFSRYVLDLADTLQDFMDQGTFDGTVDSAVRCLYRSRYSQYFD